MSSGCPFGACVLAARLRGGEYEGGVWRGGVREGQVAAGGGGIRQQCVKSTRDSGSVAVRRKT